MSNFVSHIQWNLSPDQNALVIPVHGNPPHVLTYRELHRLVISMVNGLRRRGVKQGTRVFIATAPDARFFVALLAVMSVGAVAIVVERGFSTRLLQSCFKKSRPDVIIGSKRNLVKLLAIPATWRCRRWFDDGLSVSGEISAPPPDVDDGHTALITFTSGSTGVPLGVNRTHGTLIQQHKKLSAAIPGSPPQNHLTSFPVVSLHNLCCGYTTIIADLNHAEFAETDPAGLFRQITDHQVTSISGAPSFYRIVADFAESRNLRFSEITQVVVGGAPVDIGLARRMVPLFPLAEITILYGSSEAEPISRLTVKEVVDVWNQIENVRGGYCVGFPAEGVSIKLIASTEDPVGPGPILELASGNVGEIIVAGEHVTTCYFDDEEADRRNKIKDDRGQIWHRTGDVGYIDDGGRLWLAGRRSHVIVYQGETYYPLIVESYVNQINGVHRSALAKTPAGRPVLWVMVDHADRMSDVRRVINDHRWDIPLIRATTSIPVDARHRSKTDYKALMEMTRKENFDGE